MLCLLILLGLARICTLGFVKTTWTDCDNFEDYYWRDYKGVIPEDALPGGTDANGKTTYIAQVLHKNLLIPGEIIESEKKAYYEWGFKQFEATENVKILCTRHPEQFQWIITTNEDFKTLTKNFIPGGYEPENRIYIGRKSGESVVHLGKVQVRLPDLNAVFHYTEDGEGLFSNSFEALAYIKQYVRLITPNAEKP